MPVLLMFVSHFDLFQRMQFFDKYNIINALEKNVCHDMILATETIVQTTNIS